MWWHEPTEHTPDGEGFWSVATYAEVLHVLKEPTVYSSETGGDRPYGGTLLQDLPVAGIVLNMMDDPRHGRIRRLVSKGLTPLTHPSPRRRAPPAHRRAPRRGAERRTGRLPRGGRGRAPAADDLHPARRRRGRPPRPLRRGRTRVRLPVRQRHRTRTGHLRHDGVRPRADRREARPTDATTCCRSSCTRSSTTRTHPVSPTTSCTCSSACCSRPAARRPATPSRAGCTRSPAIPSSSSRCAPIPR